MSRRTLTSNSSPRPEQHRTGDHDDRALMDGDAGRASRSIGGGSSQSFGKNARLVRAAVITSRSSAG